MENIKDLTEKFPECADLYKKFLEAGILISRHVECIWGGAPNYVQRIDSFKSGELTREEVISELARFASREIIQTDVENGICRMTHDEFFKAVGQEITKYGKFMQGHPMYGALVFSKAAPEKIGATQLVFSGGDD